jgi:hypothetical protein
MAILSDFNKAYHTGDPLFGSGSTAIGSTVFVMNTDAMTATTSWDDPYLQVGATPGEEDNIRPIIVPGLGFHLEVNVCWRGDAPAEDTPVVALYGLVPFNGGTQSRLWPCDQDAVLCGSSDGAAAANTTDFWVPLVNYDNYEIQADAEAEDADASNLVALMSSGIVSLDSGDGTPGLKLGVPRRVYLGGVTKVICTIHAAAANADAAVIIGRFIG